MLSYRCCQNKKPTRNSFKNKKHELLSTKQTSLTKPASSKLAFPLLHSLAHRRPPASTAHLTQTVQQEEDYVASPWEQATEKRDTLLKKGRGCLRLATRASTTSRPKTAGLAIISAPRPACQKDVVH